MPNDKEQLPEKDLPENEQDDLDTEEEQDQDQEQERGRGSRRPATAQEFLENEIFARAGRAQSKLRSNLIGTISICLKDTGERFLFDWSGDDVKGGKSDRSDVDCKITLSSQHFMRIAQRDLNPQIAMLSDKISVEGKLGLAIYFFNLVTQQRG